METIKSTEEKAKAYDIALDKIKRLLGTGSNCSREDLEYVFPELQESEDEQIRKEIMDIIDSFEVARLRTAGLPTRIPKYLAWLEKQVPACLSHDDEIMIRQLTEYFTTGKGLQNTNNTVVEWLADVKRKLEKQGEQKPVGFNIGDEITVNGQVCRVVAVDKDAWSKEDEYCRHQLMVFCKNCMQQDSGAIRCADWLKSLRPQNTWKPSNEQMEAIKDAIEFLGCTKKVRENLKSLYEQLKKLRGE